MARPSNVDYAAVLGDLLAKREKLDHAIEAIRQLVPEATTPEAPVTAGPLTEMGTSTAIKHVLADGAMHHLDIASALRKGGRKAVDTSVQQMCARMAQSGELIRVKPRGRYAIPPGGNPPSAATPDEATSH